MTHDEHDNHRPFSREELIRALDEARIDFSSFGESNPPPPLVDTSGDTGFSMCFREGERAVVRDRKRFHPEALFCAAFAGSYALDGQPVRCSGFLPGVSMRVVARAPAAAAELEDFVPRLWQRLRPDFERWMSLPTRRAWNWNTPRRGCRYRLPEMTSKHCGRG